MSLGGAALEVERPDDVPENAAVTLEVDLGPERVAVPGEMLRWRNGRAQLRFAPQDVRDEGNVTRIVLGRADSWVDWDRNRRDRPLRALWEVAVSIRGLFRGDSQFTRKRTRSPAKLTQMPSTQPNCAAC